MQRITKSSTLIVAASGGDVMAVNLDGEILWSVGLSGGLYPAKTYTDLLSNDQSLEVTSGVYVSTPVDRLSAIQMANANESGANPDFQVTSADRMQRELERKLQLLNQSAAKYERRMATMEEMGRRVALAPPVVASAVIDDTTPPVVKPDAPVASVDASTLKGA